MFLGRILCAGTFFLGKKNCGASARLLPDRPAQMLETSRHIRDDRTQSQQLIAMLRREILNLHLLKLWSITVGLR